MRITRRVRTLTAIAVLAFAAVLPAAAQDEIAEEIIDLGDRMSGQSYALALSAQNRNCEQPIDMRFESRGADWLSFDEGNVARQVPSGQGRDVPVTLDFSETPEGPAQARIRVICENCGFLIWQNCHISDRELVLIANVVPAPAPPPAPVDTAPPATETPPTPSADPAPNTTIDLSPPPAVAPPAAPATTSLSDAPSISPGDPQYVDPVVEGAMSEADRAALNAARARAAETASRLVGLQARRDRCEEELAALRAARDAAASAAQDSAASAGEASAAADAAEEHAGNYQADLDAASARMDSTYRTLQMQAAARTIVGNEHGTGSAAYAEADAEVNRANDAAADAQREFSEIRASQDERERAAAEARAQADAAREAANAAQAEADAAQAAVDAKEAECQGIAQEVQDAVSEAAGARDAAEDAAGGAPGAALRNLDEQIAAAEGSCRNCWREYQRLAEQQRQALLALAALGAFRENPAAQPNIMSWGELVANTLTEMAATATGVSSVGSNYMLGGLEAAYRAASIIQSEYTPWTARYNADATSDWLDRQGHSGPQASADEIRAQMELFMSEGRDARVFEERLNRLRDQCLACQGRLEELREQRAEVMARAG